MDKKAERLARLKKLTAKRVESSQQNHREVVEEYKRMKLPSNFEKKKEWAEMKLEKEKLKDQMKKEGKDYEREAYLQMQAGMFKFKSTQYLKIIIIISSFLLFPN